MFQITCYQRRFTIFRHFVEYSVRFIYELYLKQWRRYHRISVLVKNFQQGIQYICIPYRYQIFSRLCILKYILSRLYVNFTISNNSILWVAAIFLAYKIICHSSLSLAKFLDHNFYFLIPTDSFLRSLFAPILTNIFPSISLPRRCQIFSVFSVHTDKANDESGRLQYLVSFCVSR